VTELQQYDEIIKDNKKIIDKYKFRLSEFQTAGFDEGNLLAMKEYQTLK